MVSIVAIASFAFLWHFVKAVYESRSKGGGDWVNETNFCTLNITQSRRRCIYFLSWIRFLEYATREKGTPKTRHNIVLIPRTIRFQSVVKLHQKRGRKKLYVVIILLPCTTLRYIKKMPNSLSKGFGHDLKTGSTRLSQQYLYDYEFSVSSCFLRIRVNLNYIALRPQ